jgi:hypothetical protein
MPPPLFPPRRFALVALLGCRGNIEPSPGQLSGAGLLPIRQFDEGGLDDVGGSGAVEGGGVALRGVMPAKE